MSIEGVDLASHQGNYTYPTNPDFAIIKASGGHTYRNEFLAQQVANARAKNIIYGFYHYMFEPSYGTPGNPSGGDVRREAANFIEAVRPHVQPGSTFWLDVEEFPKTVGFKGDLAAWIVDFCEQVHRAFGAVCGIYCATWYLVPTGLDRARQLSVYPFWLASWQSAPPPAQFMAPWDHLTLWQYNADGIDKDRFFGTREEFLALGVPGIEKKTEIAPMLEPVVTERRDWGGKGRLIAETVTVVNNDTGVYYEGKVEHRAEGEVQLPWREV